MRNRINKYPPLYSSSSSSHRKCEEEEKGTKEQYFPMTI
jgi:hypothetical protein